MAYPRRTWIALCVSCMLHLLVVSIGWHHVKGLPVSTNVSTPPPLVFTFPPKPAPVRRIVETTTSTSEEIAETDLVSDKNSKAQDESEETGEGDAPEVDEVGEVDQLATPPIEATPVLPERPVAKATPQSSSAPAKSEIVPPKNKNPGTMASAETPEKVKTPKPKPIQLAAAPKTPPVAETPLVPKPIPRMMHIEKGRASGGTSRSGVMNFETKSHELGEYMLEVRRLVEQQWHAAIQLNYQGSKHAESVIACSIRPDGTLEYARIEEKGHSMPYAILCRDAVKRAAPYPTLPFDVPAIYKSQDIEITWRFSYM